ncbi:MAG TPA: FtsX-like permease family protein [Xanthomonadales bacterium]|nr:FtsX-like permease family protein [Xanthomonadales bacterium]
MRDELLGEQRTAVAAAAAGVALLLLISVLNLGGLALVAATRRQLEHAMRICLGASKRRLFVESAAEGAWVGIAASAIAVFTAWLLLPRLASVLPIGLPSYVDLSLRMPLALAIVGAAILCGIGAFAFGAAIAARAKPETLRSGVRATRAHGSLRKALVGGEIALGIALLAAALMLARSFASIAALDPGYRVEETAVLDVELPADRYEPGTALAFGDRLLALARATPGVEAAALSSDSPLSGDSSAHYVASDRLEANPTRVYGHAISPGYFATAGIRVVEGSEFASTDVAASEPVAIVSAKLARKLWGDARAVGQRLKRGAATSEAPWMRVVGVVDDVRWRGVPEGPTADPDVFVPLAQAPRLGFSLLVHARGEPLAVAQAVGAQLRSLDSDVPVYAVQTIAQRVHEATQIPRFLAGLGVTFSLVALLLSALGIYAIAALDGAQRVRELAIRQAVGANDRALRWLFVSEYGAIFVAAALVGIVALIPLSRLLATNLYGIGALDPASLAGAVALFMLALAAGIVAPLRRVTAVEPGILVRGD